jgi:hypothetical protein
MKSEVLIARFPRSGNVGDQVQQQIDHLDDDVQDLFIILFNNVSWTPVTSPRRFARQRWRVAWSSIWHTAMSDLAQVLPDFDVGPYSHLLHSLEKHDCTVADLVSTDPVEIARRCPLPLLDLRRLVLAVIEALQSDLRILPEQPPTTSDLLGPTRDGQQAEPASPTTLEDLGYIKTLEPEIDALLNGGLSVGYVSEVVGER